MEKKNDLGVGEDELFGQFFGALEKVHYFWTTASGDDELAVDRATHLFHNAFMEMKKSGCEEIDLKNLADAFKLQGNKAMQSKVYVDAIELYTVAIALFNNNAVYYCNRAAAYTQNNQHTEAIHDCNKAIEIDPNYSKAYSRLGFSYFSQGKYRDAIDKGFKRALQLDPNNESVRGNIQAAEQKLREERQRARQGPSSPRWFVSNGSRSDGPTLSYSDYTTNMSEAEFSNMLASMSEAVREHRQEQEQAGNVDSGDPMMERFYQMFGTAHQEHDGTPDNGNGN